MSDIITLGGPAAGGGFVGRDDEGRVLFVRHGLPGEVVKIKMTERHKRWGRADAVEILEASPDRVTPPCPAFGPDRCGGCDYQHSSLEVQRRFKSELLAEQLRRLAGITTPVVVEAVGTASGLGTRTRVRFGRSNSGSLGMRRRASHEIIEIDHCLLGTAAITQATATARLLEGSGDIEIVDLGGRATVVSDDDIESGYYPDDVTVVVGDESYLINPAGFFQIHSEAPTLLVATVLEGLALKPGDRAVDFYAGAGLFTKPMARAVGPEGAVIAVEAAPQSAASCAANIADMPWAVSIESSVTPALIEELRHDISHCVFDPPRQGIEAGVIEALAEMPQLRTCVLVSCDAATFARDLGRFMAAGFSVASLRAFDLFEMTEHAEYVALLTRD